MSNATNLVVSYISSWLVSNGTFPIVPETVLSLALIVSQVTSVIIPVISSYIDDHRINKLGSNYSLELFRQHLDSPDSRSLLKNISVEGMYSLFCTLVSN